MIASHRPSMPTSAESKMLVHSARGRSVQMIAVCVEAAVIIAVLPAVELTFEIVITGCALLIAVVLPRWRITSCTHHSSASGITSMVW